MQAHLHDLRSVVDDDALVERFTEDWRTAGLEPHVVAVLEFAAKLTDAPTTMTRADVDALRAHGYDDEDIHDATQVVAYFNYINRIADALGVPPEDGMTPWPREDGTGTG